MQFSAVVPALRATSSVHDHGTNSGAGRPVAVAAVAVAAARPTRVVTRTPRSPPSRTASQPCSSPSRTGRARRRRAPRRRSVSSCGASGRSRARTAGASRSACSRCSPSPPSRRRRSGSSAWWSTRSSSRETWACSPGRPGLRRAGAARRAARVRRRRAWRPGSASGSSSTCAPTCSRTSSASHPTPSTAAGSATRSRRITSDVAAIESFLLAGIANGISAVVRILIFGGMLFVIAWQLACWRSSSRRSPSSPRATSPG